MLGKINNLEFNTKLNKKMEDKAMKSLKKGIFVIFIIFSMVMSLSTICFAGQDVIKWKMQIVYPPGSAPALMGTEWAKGIEKLTGGRLKIQTFPPGALAGALQVVNMLEKGVFDASATYGALYTGLIPEAYLEVGLPQGPGDYAEYRDLMYNKGLIEIVREAYAEHNIFFTPVGADKTSNFTTNFPVHRLSDLKGKKIRAVGIFAKYCQKIGCVPVTIPGSELYMALKLGTVDGAIYGVSGLMDTKIHEVVKYYSLPTIQQIAGSILINMDSLKKLPPDIRKIVKEGTRYINSDTSMQYLTRSEASLHEAVRIGSVKTITLPEEELIKSRALTKALWDELAAISPRMKKG
ncbi:MAG: TRAP transporter substrate-binding protein DctP, partial [Deltaproteobacteria bacterium]|nr:TRAP transporter substrate-binding protein DctP [Deltaproteobacteria bacterium]